MKIIYNDTEKVELRDHQTCLSRRRDSLSKISRSPLLFAPFSSPPPFSTGTPLFCRNEPAGTRTRVSFYGHLCQERHNVSDS